MSEWQPLRFLPDVQAAELAGRLYECCDIQMCIEDGHLQTVADVLAWVTARADHIERELQLERPRQRGERT